MDMIKEFQEISDAVSDAQTKGDAAQVAYANLQAVTAKAEADFAATVGAAKAAYEQANDEYKDAKEAVSRLKQKVNDALGGLFASTDSRLRMG